MKKIHCPRCSIFDASFRKLKCSDDGTVCGEHYLCNRCGFRFIIVYDNESLEDDSIQNISSETTDKPSDE